MSRWDLVAEVDRAAERLAAEVYQTPLVAADWLSRELGGDVRLKLENIQATGSFKARGAANRILALDQRERSGGVVAASSGNHGLGVARAAGRAGISATVFVPETTPAAKRESIVRLGAEVVVHGADCVQTEAMARSYADHEGAVYVSPYNDPWVIAGQGTVAREIAMQWPEVERIYVAVGGGGLIGGMAAWLAGRLPSVRVVGCSPAASPAMHECVARGAIVDVACHETWSDSTHGGVEDGSITLDLCRQHVHEWLLADEASIAEAMRDCLASQHLLVEGAVGVALAAMRQDRAARGKRCAVVVCGGNLPITLLQKLLS